MFKLSFKKRNIIENLNSTRSQIWDVCSLVCSMSYLLSRVAVCCTCSQTTTRSLLVNHSRFSWRVLAGLQQPHGLALYPGTWNRKIAMRGLDLGMSAGVRHPFSVIGTRTPPPPYPGSSSVPPWPPRPCTASIWPRGWLARNTPSARPLGPPSSAASELWRGSSSWSGPPWETGTLRGRSMRRSPAGLRSSLSSRLLRSLRRVASFGKCVCCVF